MRFPYFGGLVAASLALAGPALAASTAERDAAFEALLADPANTRLAIEYTRIAAELGDYEGAVGTLEAVLLAVGDDPDLHVELASLYLRLRSVAAARFHLDSALSGADLSPRTRDRAQRLLRQVGSGEPSGHKLNGFANLGLRYRSNANFGPDTETIRALGVDVPIPAAARSEGDGDVLFTGRLQHSYAFGRANGLALETSAFAFVNRQFELDEQDTTVLELTSGPRWHPFGGAYFGWTVRPHLVTNATFRGDEFASNLFGGGLNVNFVNEGPFSLDATYQYRQRNFDGSRFADERDGHENFVAAQFRYLVGPRTQLFGRYDRIARQAANDALASDEFGFLAGIDQRYRSPLAVLPGYWRAYVSGGYRNADYKEADPRIDPNVVRNDDEYRFAVGQSIPLGSSWRANMEVSGTFVDSNIRNFSRDIWAGTLSASWAF